MGCGASVAGSCGPVKVPCSATTSSGPGGGPSSGNKSKKNKKPPLRTNKAAELRKKANEAKLASNDSLSSKKSVKSVPRTTKSKAQLRNAQLKRKMSGEASHSLRDTNSSSSTLPSQTVTNKQSTSDVPAIKQVGLTQQKDKIDAMATEIVDSSPSTVAITDPETVEKVDTIAETNTIATAPAAGEVGHLNAIPLKHHTLGIMAFEEANTIPLRNDADAAAVQEMGPSKKVNEIAQASAVDEQHSPAEAKDDRVAGENLDVIHCEKGNGTLEETKTMDTESSEQTDSIPAAANTANEAETFIPLTNDVLMTAAYQGVDSTPQKSDMVDVQEMGPNNIANEIAQASAVGVLDSPAEAKDHGAAGENLDVILNMNLVKDDAPCEEGNGTLEETKTLDTKSPEQKDVIAAAANTANEAEMFIPPTNDVLMTAAYQGVDPTPQKSDMVDVQEMGPNNIANEIAQASAVGELDSPAEVKDHGAAGENLDVILNMNLIKDDAPREERNGTSEETKTVDLESCEQTDPIPATANTANEAETFILLTNDVLMTAAYQGVDPTPQKNDMISDVQEMGPTKTANGIMQALAVEELDSPAEAKDHGAAGENLDVILNMNLVKDDAPCEERNGASEENKTEDAVSSKQKDAIPAAVNTAGESVTSTLITNDTLYSPAYQEVDSIPQKSDMVDAEGVKEAIQHTTYMACVVVNTEMDSRSDKGCIEDVEVGEEREPNKEPEGLLETIDIVPNAALENVDVTTNKNLLKGNIPLEEVTGTDAGSAKDADVTPKAIHIITTAADEDVDSTSHAETNHIVENAASKEVDCTPQKNTVSDPPNTSSNIQDTVAETRETYDTINSVSTKEVDAMPHAKHTVISLGDEKVDSDARTNCIMDEADAIEVGSSPQANQITDDSSAEKVCSIPDTTEVLDPVLGKPDGGNDVDTANKEESSNFDDELDIFISEILQSQLDLVQKLPRLPSPPKSPKPVNRRSPRVRSPTAAATDITQDTSKVLTQTNAAEENNASASSSTKGSKVDLEVVGSKCTIFATSSSPSRKDSHRSLKGISHITKSTTANRSHFNNSLRREESFSPSKKQKPNVGQTPRKSGQSKPMEDVQRRSASLRSSTITARSESKVGDKVKKNNMAGAKQSPNLRSSNSDTTGVSTSKSVNAKHSLNNSSHLPRAAQSSSDAKSMPCKVKSSKKERKDRISDAVTAGQHPKEPARDSPQKREPKPKLSHSSHRSANKEESNLPKSSQREGKRCEISDSSGGLKSRPSSQRIRKKTTAEKEAQLFSADRVAGSQGTKPPQTGSSLKTSPDGLAVKGSKGNTVGTKFRAGSVQRKGSHETGYNNGHNNEKGSEVETNQKLNSRSSSTSSRRSANLVFCDDKNSLLVCEPPGTILLDERPMTAPQNGQDKKVLETPSKVVVAKGNSEGCSNSLPRLKNDSSTKRKAINVKEGPENGRYESRGRSVTSTLGVRSSSAGRGRASATQFEQLQTKNTLAFARPSYPELRPKSSVGSSLNRMEVLSPEKHQGSSSKQRSLSLRELKVYSPPLEKQRKSVSPIKRTV